MGILDVYSTLRFGGERGLEIDFIGKGNVWICK